MKKIILLLTIGIFGLHSCTGPEGIPGHDGQDGYSVEAEVFEVTATFTSSNNFTRFIPLTPAILSSDVVLVYRLYEVVNGEDVWRLIPQTVYLPQGEFDYNYDFTRNDINIFLDSDFDLNTLGSEWANNQIFRIVIVPGYFSKTTDVTNFKEVTKQLKVNDTDFKKSSIK